MVGNNPGFSSSAQQGGAGSTEPSPSGSGHHGHHGHGRHHHSDSVRRGSIDSPSPHASTGLKRAVLSKLGICGKAPEVRTSRPPGPVWIFEFRIRILQVSDAHSDEEERRSAPPLRSPRLVSIRFEVAGGLNLALMSPVRKSRRTPSHEAITQLATKYKVREDIGWEGWRGKLKGAWNGHP